MKTSTRNLLGLAAVLLAGVVAGYFLAAGNRSYPAPQPTATPDPMIVIDAPQPGATVSSPLTVTGRARGPWYFEASFPVVLTGPGGAVLATVPAQAQGDWMTTDWVPFTATLVFTAPPPGSTGTLILRKDNPSGDPQRDDSRTLSVQF